MLTDLSKGVIEDSVKECLTKAAALYFGSEAEYNEAVADGKIDENQVCVVGAPSGPRFTLGTDGSVSYTYYSQFEYEQDGIQIENIKDTANIYKAVYTSLVQNNPDKKEDWNVLLKLNDNNYRLTVIQIETSQLEMEVK